VPRLRPMPLAATWPSQNEPAWTEPAWRSIPGNVRGVHRHAVIHERGPVRAGYPRKELVRRLQRRLCELCEHGPTVNVHQIAGLSQLGLPGPGQPAWAALMANKRRKTLVVCADCHDYIHANPVTHAA
jgi:hypothetical protein